MAIWSTAAHYHLAFAILIQATVWAGQIYPAAARRLQSLIIIWLSGIALFSGSLYGLALGAPKFIGFVTPVGGLCLLAGWVMAMRSLLPGEAASRC